MTNDKFDLSRRKVLGSLGVVGTGAVLGGAGTAALFNDQDDVTGNQMTAGQLDLLVDYKAKNTSISQVSTSEGQDGGDLSGFELSDIKPGDEGYVKFCLTPDSNPAWIWMDGVLTVNDENGTTEPELDVDDPDDENDQMDGELAQNIDATLRYDNGDEITSGTLEEVLGYINGGIQLDGDPGTDGTDAFSENSKACIYIDWSVDFEDVGNVIQTDTLKFDVSFYAEQERHNGNPDNPFSS